MDKRTYFAFLDFIDNSFPNHPTPEEKQAMIQQQLDAIAYQDRQVGQWLRESDFCETFVQGLFKTHVGDTAKVKSELHEVAGFIHDYQLETLINEAYKKCKEQYGSKCTAVHSGHADDPA